MDSVYTCITHTECTFLYEVRVYVMPFVLLSLGLNTPRGGHI